MIDEYYSPGTYQLHRYIFVVGCYSQSRIIVYFVKYTLGYDTGRTRGRILLNEYTQRSISYSYFGVVSVRKKVRNWVNIVTPEKRKVGRKKDISTLAPSQKLLSELIERNSKNRAKGWRR